MTQRDAESAPDAEPRRFGDYLVKESIGSGAQGEVYRAEQAVLGRDAVVKVLRLPEAPADELKARFLREAQIASRLDHPYAAHVYGFGAEDDTLWIAMEYVRGTSMADFLAISGPMPPPRFVPVFERLCQVVHSAHEQGIIHRDIKPANVMMVSRAGRSASRRRARRARRRRCARPPGADRPTARGPCSGACRCACGDRR